MAYIVMARIVMALEQCLRAEPSISAPLGLYSYGLYSYGQYKLWPWSSAFEQSHRYLRRSIGELGVRHPDAERCLERGALRHLGGTSPE